MINKNYSKILFSTILFLLSFSWSAYADIKVIVNDDLITTVDIQEGLKAKLARSKEVRQAMMRRFKSDSTKARWREMVMAERPSSREEAQALQKNWLPRLNALFQEIIDQDLKNLC